MAVAVGGNIATLSVVDRLLFRAPAAVAAPGELRRLYIRQQVWNRAAFTSASFSYLDFSDLKSIARPLATLAAYATADHELRENGRRIAVAYASPEYFGALGTSALLGRVLPATAALTDPEVVLGYDLWRTGFGSDSSIVGRVVTVDRMPVTVVGVAAVGFRGVDVEAIDAWIPLGFRGGPAEGSWRGSRQARFLDVIARMNPRVSESELEARLTTEYRRAHLDDETEDPRAAVLVGPLASARGPAELLPLDHRNLALTKNLAGLSLAVLLAGIAQCASLLLLSAVRRRRDIAIHLALGLSRRRLIFQLAAEHALLAVVAISVSLGTAWLASAWLQAAILSTIEGSPLSLDGRAMALLSGFAVGGILCAAIGPVLLLARTEPVQVMHARTGSMGIRDSRLRRGVVVLHTALSVALISIATVFVTTLRRDIRDGLSYDHSRLATVVLGRLDSASTRGILERLRSLVPVAAASNAMNDLAPGRAMTRFALEQTSDAAQTTLVSFNAVDTSYFRTVGLSLVGGRFFTAEDSHRNERVAIATVSAVKSFWRGRSALGQCAFLFDAHTCVRIVGVVRDIRWDLSRPPLPHFYVPLAQSSGAGRVIILRTRQPTSPADIAALERTLKHLTDTIGVSPQVSLLSQRLARQIRPLQAASGVLLVYGILVLVSAVLGVYGQVVYEVAQRRKEIGIRAALGASATDLIALVLRGGIRLLAAGLLLGIGFVWLSAGVLESFVFGASADRPLVVLGVVSALMLAGVVAMLAGARSTAQLSPANALRPD